MLPVVVSKALLPSPAGERFSFLQAGERWAGLEPGEVEGRGGLDCPGVEVSILGTLERGEGAGEGRGVFLDLGLSWEDLGEKRFWWRGFLVLGVEVSLEGRGDRPWVRPRGPNLERRGES